MSCSFSRKVGNVVSENDVSIDWVDIDIDLQAHLADLSADVQALRS